MVHVDYLRGILEYGGWAPPSYFCDLMETVRLHQVRRPSVALEETSCEDIFGPVESSDALVVPKRPLVRGANCCLVWFGMVQWQG